MKFSFSLLFSALLISALPLAAQVPQALNYQGRVAVNGSAFTGTGQFRFALVDGAGAVLWSSHASAATPVSVAAGLYSVRLGDTTLPNMAAVPSALFANADLRLRVWFDDGVNGPQQLAPDQRLAPVGYAHRAASADSVPASAIAPRSIQPSHLAASVQTGSAAGLASIPAAGGVLNVTFPQPFETPPAVTLAGLTVPPANVTTTGFSYTVPPRDLLVDDGSPPSSNVGKHRDIILVGGFPAIAYTDDTSGDLKYIRATNAQGTAWGAPVTAAVGGTAVVGQYCSMALVGANPAIAYYDATNKDLKYVRANDTTGAAWGAPVTVASHATDDLGKGCKLRYIIQSVSVRRPVIAYHDGTAGTVRVKIANDGAGTAWGAQQTPDPALSGLTDSSAFDLIPNGTGVEVFYHDPANDRLSVVVSPTIAPAAWGIAQGLGSSVAFAGSLDSFFTPGGRARCYVSNGIVYAESAPVFSSTQSSSPHYSVVPGGSPQMVIQQGGSLYIADAEDLEGLAWKPVRPVPGTPSVISAPRAIRLADGATLAVFYADAGSGQLRVSGATAPATAEWQAQLASPLIASGVTAGSITRDSLAPEFFGENSRSPGSAALAFGSGTLAVGAASLASGKSTTASGSTSTAMGYITTASGDISTAMGFYTAASGDASIATGAFTTASGSYSTAMGYDTRAIGNYSTTMGSGTIAFGEYSTAMGISTYAPGGYSTAMGASTTASGYYSTAMGYDTTASGIYSTAMGNQTTANGGESTALGYYTIADGNVSTAMGYATTASGGASTAMGSETEASGEYSTAMGSETIASGEKSTAMGYNTTASGDYSTAMGHFTTASYVYSTAMGSSTTASGNGSTAMGASSTASGGSSTAMGYGTRASGTAATAMGWSATASGDGSTAMGYYTNASATYSTAMGIGTDAETYAETSLGSYPLPNTGDADSFVSADVLLEVGNGTSTTRSNALTMLKNGRVLLGNGPITHHLTLENGSTGGRASSWTTYSDSRIKTEQRPLPYGLAELMRLQPRAYNQHAGCVEQGTFKCADETPGGKPTIGFIAQEVAQVIPEAVEKPEDPANQLYGMDYQKLVPVLVKAAQELKAENDTLKTGTAALKTELEATNADSAALKTQLEATNAALRLLQQRLDRLERPARKR